MNARILVVEDETNLRLSLGKYLREHGFEVHEASSLAEARSQLAPSAAQAIVLDWMLPDGEGIDWLKELRRAGNETPVILLTARVDLVDKVVGLESGANDYLTKPFEPRELIARLRVQLRTKSPAAASQDRDEIIIGELRVIPVEHAVHFAGRRLELTKMEYDLLTLLAQHPGRVFTREELLNKVWGFDRYPTTRTVDTHVLMLRQKTADALIETIRGVGYRLALPELK